MGFFPQAGANGIHWDFPASSMSSLGISQLTEASHFFPSPGGSKNPAKIPMELPSEIPLEKIPMDVPLQKPRSLVSAALAYLWWSRPWRTWNVTWKRWFSHRFVDDFPISMFDMFDSYDVILDDFNINFIFWGYSCSDHRVSCERECGPWMPSGAEIHDGCPPADLQQSVVK